MSVIFSSTEDGAALRALLEEILRRLNDLETANPLNHASVDSGTGVGVYTQSGIHIEGEGTATAGEASMSRANGGRFKAGAAELDAHDGGRVGSGGTWVDKDGIFRRASGAIQFANGLQSTGAIISDTVVQGRTGVRTPWKGGTALVETIVGQVETTATNAVSAASAAASAASAAAGAASNAHGRANEAHSLATQAKSAADTAQGTADGIKNGTTPLQTPTLVAPKMTGLSSGGTGSGWVALMINTSTGQIRMYGD